MQNLPTPSLLTEELRTRRNALLKRLSECVQESRRVQDEVLPAIMQECDKHFRALEIELQKASLNAAELARREELFRTKLERGEKLTPQMIAVVNAIVEREFARMRRRLSEAFSMTNEERETAAKARNKAASVNEQEIAKMYRAIVKKLHPDKQNPHANTPQATSEDPSSLFAQFWQTTQNAYEHKNQGDLQTIYDLVCAGSEEEFSEINVDGTVQQQEYLKAEIMRLEARLRVEERKLRDLTASEPYTLQDLLKSQTWCASEQKRLRNDIQEKQREAERSRAFLASLHADMPLPAPSSEKQEERAFHNDFMENTYFSSR